MKASMFIMWFSEMVLGQNCNSETNELMVSFPCPNDEDFEHWEGLDRTKD